MHREQILARYVETQKTNEHEYISVCPYHDDSRPSLSVNEQKWLFFCHACGKKGSVNELLATLTKYPVEVVQYELNFLKHITPLDFNVDHFHRKLLGTQKVLDYLYTKRKWTLEAIKHLQIGYDGDRILIPVFTAFGDIANVRAYKPGASKSENKFLNTKGHGKARLFNLGVFKQLQGSNDQVLLTEGEPDCIAAVSAGFSAVSTTSGAGHFSSDDGTPFRQKDLLVVYDVDEAGKEGASKIVPLLYGVASSVKLIDLSPHLKVGNDLTDFLANGGTAEQLKEIFAQTPPVQLQPIGEVGREVHPTVDVTLAESSEKDFYKQSVRIRVMVVGKTLAPYMIPKKVLASCNNPGLTMCQNCALPARACRKELEFSDKHEEILQLVDTTVEGHERVFKKLAGIPAKCKIVDFNITEAQNVEEAKVIPNVDYSTDESNYVIRQIYFLGHSIQPNSTYIIEGLTLPHPRTQQVTYLVSKAEPLEDSVSQFEVTTQVINSLRVFSVRHEENSGQVA